MAETARRRRHVDRHWTPTARRWVLTDDSLIRMRRYYLEYDPQNPEYARDPEAVYKVYHGRYGANYMYYSNTSETISWTEVFERRRCVPEGL